MAGGEGFEPPLTESESVVLPLDDPPGDRFLFVPVVSAYRVGQASKHSASILLSLGSPGLWVI